MAKKIVRGITDVKTITNQDLDTNNVNDLLSDGQYNYIHRKKGETEEYHNLTDNIKTISSDNTELLTVTNNNKTTNTATLHPKHDAQKEQVLESTRDTITINHGTNGTAEKTTVDTNPQKVLEHSNLLTDYGISKTKSGNTTKLGIEFTRVPDGFDLNTLTNGKIRSSNLTNGPEPTGWFFVSAYSEGSYTYQRAIKLVHPNNTAYVRSSISGSWGAWREQVTDKSVIDGLLAQKQDVLTAGTGITIQGNTISASDSGAPVQGASISIQDLTPLSFDFSAWKHVVTIGQQTLTTFSFICSKAECVVTGELKQQLDEFVPPTFSISNGNVTISNDGTNMKLINSAPSENVMQNATFTYYQYSGGGGPSGN